jgi:hypothetical protein
MGKSIVRTRQGPFDRSLAAAALRQRPISPPATCCSAPFTPGGCPLPRVLPGSDAYKTGTHFLSSIFSRTRSTNHRFLPPSHGDAGEPPFLLFLSLFASPPRALTSPHRCHLGFPSSSSPECAGATAPTATRSASTSGLVW